MSNQNTLDWVYKTNSNIGSCSDAQCNCIQFLQIYQQEAMKRVSNLVSANNYELEPGYEARARRIASVYAKVFLETEVGGNSNLLGRYYWMGLGAFASKTVAMVFNATRSTIAYNFDIFIDSDEALDTFAKGNLWLFMDISLWHYVWSVSPSSFEKCKGKRDVRKFVDLKTSINNLPWSSCLSDINYLKVTPEINEAFGLLPTIESIFNANPTLSLKFHTAQKQLLKHILGVAVQEQKNILQKIAWDDESLKSNLKAQRRIYLNWATIDQTLGLSSDYDVDKLKKRSDAKRLSEAPWIAPPKGTIVENYDSRMAWINDAAKKYHRLMLNDKGRNFLISEMRIIATWGNSRDNFRIHPKSNEGKR